MDIFAHLSTCLPYLITSEFKGREAGVETTSGVELVLFFCVSKHILPSNGKVYNYHQMRGKLCPSLEIKNSNILKSIDT